MKVGMEIGISDYDALFVIPFRMGSIGALGTKSEHKRKGFGRYLTAHIAAELMSQGKSKSVKLLLFHQNIISGFVPYAHFDQGNEPSINLFKTLGFKEQETLSTWTIITNELDVDNIKFWSRK